MKELEKLGSEMFRALTDADIDAVSGAGTTTTGGHTSSSTERRTHDAGQVTDTDSDTDHDGGIDVDW